MNDNFGVKQFVFLGEPDRVTCHSINESGATLNVFNVAPKQSRPNYL